MVLLPDNANHLIEPLYIAVLKQFTLVLRKCVSGFMLENAITKILKNMQLLLGKNIGKKVLNLKLKILIMYLERQVFGICLLLP